MADYEIKDGSNKKWPTMIDGICDMAFDQADEFMALGQSPSEAGSIVAHALMVAAWQVAGCGKIADGGTPDPEKFVRAAENVTSVVEFGDGVEDK